MKKITLNVDGRKMSFTKQELIDIIKEHFPNPTKVVKQPTENEWFEVKPQAIDQKIFEEERKDFRQEETRKLIVEAFAKMKKNPEKYGKNFKTMFPKKEWVAKTIAQLEEMASERGDHNADWVEQALEWAQRIANGEAWKCICNYADEANYYRVVIYKLGDAKLVGGSVKYNDIMPASHVSSSYYGSNCIFSGAVPLIVLYEK